MSNYSKNCTSMFKKTVIKETEVVHVALVSLSLTYLSLFLKFHTVFLCFHSYLWTKNSWLWSTIPHLFNMYVWRSLFSFKNSQKNNWTRQVFSWKGYEIKVIFHIATRNIWFSCYKFRLRLLWHEHWLLSGKSWILYSFLTTCVFSGYLFLLKICSERFFFIFICLSILTFVFRFSCHETSNCVILLF